ncbi:hypothetical protein PVAG01_04207 [Phlyctema vagabunda]|uniref:Zn(2)-C6 fungal-type domain-containing protein n=1 Tax=Phlyctema vagabunda TaxID=108571 RepID=A0ABR4PPV6_9HELO
MSLPAPPPKEKSSVAQAARRKNTTKACEECRRRRAKCNGQQPCLRCVARAADCHYAVEPDGRRPAPRSYVDLLRNRITNLERTLLANGIDVDENGSQIRSTKENLDEVSTADSDSNTELCTKFEGALTLEESLNFDQDGEIRYFGPASGRLEFRREKGEAFQAKQIIDKTDLGPLERPKALSCETNVLSSKLEFGEPSEELKEHLLQLYFRWEQPWCPVVNETIFRDSEQSDGKYHSPLLLNCILAIGSRYSDRVEVRSEVDDPNTAGQPFMRKAEALLQVELKYPGITTIQSMAIIGVMYVAVGCDAAGWLYHGMANRLALDMGLNLDASSLKGATLLPLKDIILRRQVYWALYCIDKLSASYTGRVCTMLDCQGIVELPKFAELNNNCLSEDESHIRFRCALITTCRMLEKILTSLYAPKPLLSRARRGKFLEEMLLELRTWLYDLPSDFRVDRTSGSEILPQAYILQMVYHTSLILLMKPFLTPQNSASTEPASQEYEDGISKKACIQCYESAREISDIARRYQQRFGSFRRSPITSTHCTLSAALILLQVRKASAGQNDNSPDYHIERCLRVLHELSTSWRPAKKMYDNLITISGPRTNQKRTQEHSQEEPALENQLQRPEEETPSVQSTIATSDQEGSDCFIPGTERFLNQNSHNPGMDYDWSNEALSQPFFANDFDFMFDTLPTDYESFESLHRNQLDERW